MKYDPIDISDMRLDMKCMDCGIPVDDLTYYCDRCRNARNESEKNVRADQPYHLSDDEMKDSFVWPQQEHFDDQKADPAAVFQEDGNMRLHRKCMDCGIPVDDLTFYCDRCRSAHDESEKHVVEDHKENLAATFLANSLSTPKDDVFSDSLKIASYLWLKHKQNKLDPEQSSHVTESEHTDDE